MSNVLSYFFPNKWTNSWTVAVCKNEDLQKHANIIMVDVIETLTHDNIITREVATKFLNEHNIVVISSEWLNEHLDDTLKLEPGHITYRVTKND